MEHNFGAVHYRTCEDVGVVTLRNPPVNGISYLMRCALIEAFTHAQADPSVRAIVLTGEGRGFSAGADIREFGTPAATARPALSLDVHPVIEGSLKPTVAAIHGLAVGGGLETALVCHYRLATATARIALPETKLALIPLSGTQRLPRVLDLEPAVDFILTARTMLAGEFPSGTLFDEVLTGDAPELLDAAVRFARAAAERHASGAPLPLIRHRAVRAGDAAAVLSKARMRATGLGVGAVAAVQAIEAAIECADFDAGMTRARAIYDELISSDEVKRQRDRFLAERGH